MHGSPEATRKRELARLDQRPGPAGQIAVRSFQDKTGRVAGLGVVGRVEPQASHAELSGGAAISSESPPPMGTRITTESRAARAQAPSAVNAMSWVTFHSRSRTG